ncbi:unnamed protein product, partial [Onchocerca ochengi]
APKFNGKLKVMCCTAGKIKLPQFGELLELLKTLLAGFTNESKRQKIQLAYPNNIVRRRNCNVITKNAIHGTCEESAEDGGKLTTTQMWNGDIQVDNR